MPSVRAVACHPAVRRLARPARPAVRLATEAVHVLAAARHPRTDAARAGAPEPIPGAAGSSRGVVVPRPGTRRPVAIPHGAGAPANRRVVADPVPTAPAGRPAATDPPVAVGLPPTVGGRRVVPGVRVPTPTCGATRLAGEPSGVRYGAGMSDALDVDAMIQRFQDRAHAVRNRTLPPVAGEERMRFIRQAEVDFQDFAIIGDAEATLEDGVLVLRVDLRTDAEKDA